MADDDDKSEKSEQTPHKEQSPSSADRAKELQNHTKIADRLSAEVDASEAAQKRSADLVGLKADYNAMRDRMRHMITATKKYLESRRQVEKSRTDFAMHVSNVLQDKPLVTFSHVYEEVAIQGATDDKELVDILEYIIEWEGIVTTQVDGEIKEVKKLSDNLRHYENKVENLRKKKNDAVAKNKNYDNTKLERNEGKLATASETHGKAASRLAYLIIEFVHHGCEDLFPLLEKIINYEFTRSHKESKIFSQFHSDKEQILSECRLTNGDGKAAAVDKDAKPIKEQDGKPNDQEPEKKEEGIVVDEET